MPITIYAYKEAPEELQFYRGGDEDWVIFIPTNAEVPDWLERQIDLNDAYPETCQTGTYYVLCHA